MKVACLVFVSKKVMTTSTLSNLLLDNVLDLRFNRRVLVEGKSPVRRMLCTKSHSLLSSTNGRIVLNYKPPRRGKQFNESRKDAVVVWDIFMQDYRVVPVDNVQVIKKIPADDSFWKYFNEEVYILSTEQKRNYMNG
jgi:hypothetical protein